ncbi:Os05g0193850 [Oryza sativa Japonica Group]|nr:Os05g0193850 [Oryza sativa Japonica Group]
MRISTHSSIVAVALAATGRSGIASAAPISACSWERTLSGSGGGGRDSCSDTRQISRKPEGIERSSSCARAPHRRIRDDRSPAG